MDDNITKQELLAELSILRGSQAQTLILLESIPHGVQVNDVDGVILYSNPAHHKICGYFQGDIVGKRLWELVIPETKEQLKDGFLKIVQQQPEPTPYYTTTVTPNGEKVDVQVDWAYKRDEQGKLLGFISVVTDITERKRTEEALRRSEKQYRDLFENSRDAILIIEDDKFVECNQATLDMLGYEDKHELLQSHPSKLSPPRQPDGRDSEEKANEMMKIALEQGSNRYEWDHVRANGEVFPVEVLLTPLVSEAGVQVIHTVWRDISIQKQQREHILYQAHYDSLTGLPNRFLSLDRLEQLLKEGHRRDRSVAVLFLDLDDFKKVNDNLGHEYGDKILQQAAKRLQKAIREDDTVGRLGGDEFIVLLGDLGSAVDAAPVANTLLEYFQEPFSVDGRELVLTASVGIACYPEDGENSSDLLRRADTAMYHSKSQGRNTCNYFTEAMNEDVSRRMAIEQQLHNALNNEEFYVVYHPLVCIAEKKVVGAEALLRWDNPLLKSPSPEEFIPIAEQTGHIVPIGQFVLSEALAVAAKCKKAAGDSFKMSVNISARQFRDPDLLSHIVDLIQRHNLSGSDLELEITESALLSNHAHVKHTLKAISGLGIGIAMDDFGTGYSSMSYLRCYPFDTLKIDRSFVGDLFMGNQAADKADKELINATVALARGLGLKVIAEGAENYQQFAYLENQGCELVQGYYFSEPLCEDEFMAFLKRGLA